MNSTNRLCFITFFILVVLVMMWGPLQVRSQSAQNVSSLPSSFSYQGQLKKDGLYVNGTYDMQFKLYDEETEGDQIGNTLLIEDVMVTDGIFSIVLDFGTAAFQEGARWLQVAVKPSAGDEYSTLSPRQLISPSPYVADLHGRVEALAALVNELHGQIINLEDANSDLQAEMAALQGAVLGLEESNALLSREITGLKDHSTLLKEILAGLSRDEIDGCDTLVFSGMNVQIINGEGITESSNGVGNLIVGYNEKRSYDNQRTGSHFVIIGRGNNYRHYGGIVAGYFNEASGEYASVSGGQYNVASGRHAAVSGGFSNEAGGENAAVSGGIVNSSTGFCASVSGGSFNTASGQDSSVSGGSDNTASGWQSSVSGGNYNRAVGEKSSILGGNNVTVSTTNGIYPL